MCLGGMYTKSVIFLMLTHMLQRFTFVFPDDQKNPSLVPDKYMISRPQPYELRAIER